MAKKNKSVDVDSLPAALCQRVESAANIAAATPRQFEMLSESIRRRTGVLLSPTTLKRLWGYIDEPVTPRQSTLDVLARFCGWRDYEDFVTGHLPEVESGNIGSRSIRAEELRPGARVRLFWPPARVCEIEYRGATAWEVLYSEGTRLKAGDSFRCPLIVSGEPLYLDHLAKEGSRGGVYVCGRKSGISFEVLQGPEE